MGKQGKLGLIAGAAAGVALLASATSASAVIVNWADLTDYSVSGSTWTVHGNITVGAQNIGVTFVGDGVGFVQTNGVGTNYWIPSAPYTSGSVENAPPDADIIALDVAGLKTITFSQAVSDVYLGLVSWNGNSGAFNQPITPISSGCGYWGCGSFDNVTSNSFDAVGELHGVLEFGGNFSQVSFTDSHNEYWHGIQIGIAGVAPPGVPEPASWALMIGGFGLAGAALRRRRATVAA